MPHKIFLSHNHKDKPLVEPVAIRLANIFGQDQVFYDSWSIRPGDGIIDQMNRGLEAPDFVFFFVTSASLGSAMVKLEWQNALYSATKGHTRIIPVRVDGSAMPAILSQTVYIDMHTIGLEAAIAQIVSVTQGGASFTPQHQGFQNLSYEMESLSTGEIVLTVRASHLMEPNPTFLTLFDNTETEVAWSVVNCGALTGGFLDNLPLQNGKKLYGAIMRPLNLSLTPAFPIRIKLAPKGEAPVRFQALFHQTGEDQWSPVAEANTWKGVGEFAVQPKAAESSWKSSFPSGPSPVTGSNT